MSAVFMGRSSLLLEERRSLPKSRLCVGTKGEFFCTLALWPS